MWIGIAVTNEDGIFPYTSVTFHNGCSSYTIGNYTMHSPDYQHLGNSPMLSLMFITGPSITSYDQEGHSYSGNGTIDILSVIHPGPFHLVQSPLAIGLRTPYPWCHIQRIDITYEQDERPSRSVLDTF